MGRLLKRLPTFTLRIFGDHVNNRCVQLEAALRRMISVCHESITRAIRKQNDLSALLWLSWYCDVIHWSFCAAPLQVERLNNFMLFVVPAWMVMWRAFSGRVLWTKIVSEMHQYKQGLRSLHLALLNFLSQNSEIRLCNPEFFPLNFEFTSQFWRNSACVCGQFTHVKIQGNIIELWDVNSEFRDKKVRTARGKIRIRRKKVQVHNYRFIM